MFSFYKLVEALEILEEDKWMKSAGVDPSGRYSSQWKRLMTRAAELRKKERSSSVSGPPSSSGYSVDSFRNAQVSKKLAKAESLVVKKPGDPIGRFITQDECRAAARERYTPEELKSIKSMTREEFHKFINNE